MGVCICMWAGANDRFAFIVGGCGCAGESAGGAESEMCAVCKRGGAAPRRGGAEPVTLRWVRCCAA